MGQYLDKEGAKLLWDKAKEYTDNQLTELDTNGYDYVDMGEAGIWATCNIGASKPEEAGLYFAWGETESKETYTWDNYKFGTQNKLTKYNSTDGLITLELEDDAAHVNMGGNWRMPTYKEFENLIKTSTLNVVKDKYWEFINKNNESNKLIIPIESGYDAYNIWTNNRTNSNDKALEGVISTFNKGTYSYDRYEGFQIRAILDTSSKSPKYLTKQEANETFATKEEVNNSSNDTFVIEEVLSGSGGSIDYELALSLKEAVKSKKKILRRVSDYNNSPYHLCNYYQIAQESDAMDVVIVAFIDSSSNTNIGYFTFIINKTLSTCTYTCGVTHLQKQLTAGNGIRLDDQSFDKPVISCTIEDRFIFIDETINTSGGSITKETGQKILDAYNNGKVLIFKNEQDKVFIINNICTILSSPALVLGLLIVRNSLAIDRIDLSVNESQDTWSYTYNRFNIQSELKAGNGIDIISSTNTISYDNDYILTSLPTSIEDLSYNDALGIYNAIKANKKLYFHPADSAPCYPIINNQISVDNDTMAVFTFMVHQRENSFNLVEGHDRYIYFTIVINPSLKTVTQVNISTEELQSKLTPGTGINIENNIISCTLDTKVFEVVQSLPSQPAEGNENKIHLVLAAQEEEGNKYEEYLWVDNSWELLGTSKFNVDLSNVVTFDDVATNDKNGLLSSQLFNMLSRTIVLNAKFTGNAENVAVMLQQIAPGQSSPTVINETINAATSTTAGAMSADDKNKLDSLDNSGTIVYIPVSSGILNSDVVLETEAAEKFEKAIDDRKHIIFYYTNSAGYEEFNVLNYNTINKITLTLTVAINAKDIKKYSYKYSSKTLVNNGNVLNASSINDYSLEVKSSSDYSSLDSKDANTLYIILDDEDAATLENKTPTKVELPTNPQVEDAIVEEEIKE